MAALIGVSTKPDDQGGGYSCKVPLDLLAEDGVPPEQGDKVSYSVEGTVDTVDASTATVTINSINGQPVDSSSAAESTASPDSSAAMRDKLLAGASGGGPPGGGGGLGMF